MNGEQNMKDKYVAKILIIISEAFKLHLIDLCDVIFKHGLLPRLTEEECEEISLQFATPLQTIKNCFYLRHLPDMPNIPDVPIPNPPIGERPEKPPLGIMPEKIWMERRIKELSKAINRRSNDCVAMDDVCIIGKWAEEMQRHMQSLKEEITS